MERKISWVLRPMLGGLALIVVLVLALIATGKLGG
jgi:hypothetical protein